MGEGIAIDKPVGRWLLTGALMVFVMVLIGGITRLTGSGLSIVEWKVVTGTVPPFSDAAWEKEFKAYQTSPQFQQVNSGMTVSDFKRIYWWEYIHRLWGRLIGLVFVVPFIIFWRKGRLSPRLRKHVLIAAALGGFQGFLGWYMVKSGLADVPRVSPYRLGAHLLLALFVFSYLLTLTLSVYFPKQRENNVSVRKLTGWLLALTAAQLFYGALMSGLKAGLFAPTFPTINGEWVPAGVFMGDSIFVALFENVVSVQFVHRLTAVIILILALYLAWRAFSGGLKTRRAGFLLAAAALTQFALGVITILNCEGQVPAFWGVLHQAGAGVLLAALVSLRYFSSAD